jgi:serine/threonine protein kinase
VTVRILDERILGDGAHRAAARTALESLLTVRHPSLAYPLEIVLHDDGPDYLVLRPLPTTTLEDAVQGEPLDRAGLRRLLLPPVTALTHAHGRGLAHLALQPSSIHVSPQGDVLVAEVGVRQVLSETTDAELRRGRAGFRPPEQGDLTSTGPPPTRTPSA